MNEERAIKQKRSQLEIHQNALAKLQEREKKLKVAIKQAKAREEKARQLKEKADKEAKRKRDAHCLIKLGGILWREIRLRQPGLEIDAINYDALSLFFSKEKNSIKISNIACIPQKPQSAEPEEKKTC